MDGMQAHAHMSMKNIGFDSIWIVLDFLRENVSFQKKTRIVLDYDPQKEKGTITCYSARDNNDSPED